MTSSYTSQAGLIFNKQGTFVVPPNDLTDLRPIPEARIPGVLEIFTHFHSLADAYQAYQTARQTRAASLPMLSNLLAEMVDRQAALLLVRQKVFVCDLESVEQAYMFMIDPESSPQTIAKTPGIRDLTAMSKNMPLVAAALQAHFHIGDTNHSALTREEF